MALDLAHASSLLKAYTAFNQDDAALQDRFLEFLDRVNAESGSHADGRLSAGGWIIDRVSKQVLLIHNRKLQLWLNPGGKYEPGDSTIAATMQREVREEAGIIAPATAPLFDISYIGFDYNPRLPCPMFDFRFLVEADSRQPLLPSESGKQPQWLTLPEVKARMPDDVQNARLLRRTEALFGQ